MRISDWSSDVCSSDLADVENSECVESEGIRLADDVEKRCDLGRAGAETDLRQAVPDFLVAVKNARDVVHGSGRAFREAAHGTLARTIPRLAFLQQNGRRKQQDRKSTRLNSSH